MADFHRDIMTALLENEDTSAFVLMTILINEFEDKDIFESEIFDLQVLCMYQSHHKYYVNIRNICLLVANLFIRGFV